ncbi:MAG: 2-phosphosulfolactate phosphatase [Verrucomicrobiota bacterium]
MKSIVLYGPSDWSRSDLQLPSQTLAVVIDVLRATSTLVTALAGGVREIYPLQALSAALSHQQTSPRVKLAGEQGGRKIEGFDFGNSPLEFISTDRLDFDLAMLTTNGTRAFAATHSAEQVIAASFLNHDTVVEKVLHWPGSVVYFCAGTGDDFSLEDAIVAGSFLEKTEPNHPLAALYRFTRRDLTHVFQQTKNGANLVKIGMASDIDFCLQLNRYPILPMYDPQTGIVRLHC